jgi:ATP:ADP antiporter, AAA family
MHRAVPIELPPPARSLHKTAGLAAHFFLVVATFWLLKPLKKALFIARYDEAGLSLHGWALNAAQVEQLAKVVNVAAAFVATMVFVRLAQRHRRHALTLRLALFFAVAFVALSAWLATPSTAAVWCFYVLADLFSTLMLASFFVVQSDSVTPAEATRNHAWTGLGGVLGGVVGSYVMARHHTLFTPSVWLLICAWISLLIACISWATDNRSAHTPREQTPATSEVSATVRDAWRMVRASPYLMSIVCLVTLYETASSVLDFQFTATIAHYADGADIGRHMGEAFAWMNGTALLVQLLLTGFVLRRFGVAGALLVMPIVMLLGALSFMAAPTLWLGKLMPALDGGFAYSINQSAREALYVPTSPQQKYAAKALVDMLVTRAAKGLAVCISLGLTWFATDFAYVRWLSVLTVCIAVAWWMSARFAGAQFARLSRDETARAGQAPKAPAPPQPIRDPGSRQWPWRDADARSNARCES